MLTNSFCRDSDSADSRNKGYFGIFRTMHSSRMLREGARPEVVRDVLGHASIDVTQNVYGKSWWEERVDAATQAVEGVTNTAQNAEKEEKKNQPESVSSVS
jgi:integrase